MALNDSFQGSGKSSLLYQQLELSRREIYGYSSGNLRKKVTFLLVACIMSLVVIFLGFYAFNTPYRQTTPLDEVIRDPSSWVNKSVTVEGILATVPLPNPTFYGLFPENQTVFLNVQWNSSDVLILQYNATAAIVHGVIREEEWTAPNVMPPNSIKEVVYYIEAEKVELL
jgi:hypothetical protein